MGLKDVVESKKIEKAMKRKAAESSLAERKRHSEFLMEEELNLRREAYEADVEMWETDKSGDEACDNDLSPSFENETVDRSLRTNSLNLTRLPNAAQQAVRCGVSPGAAALILTGVLSTLATSQKMICQMLSESGKWH